jgi:hypothetical protein
MKWIILIIFFAIVAVYIRFSVRFSRNRNKATQQTGEKWYQYASKEIFAQRGHRFLSQHFRETFEPERVRVEMERHFVQTTVLGVYLRLLEEKGEDATKYDALPVDMEAITRARISGRQAFRSWLPYDNISV